MTQDEKWVTKYNEVVTFIETNKLNPSKHRIEEQLNNDKESALGLALCR